MSLANYKVAIYFALALLFQPIICVLFGFTNAGPNLLLAVGLMMALLFGDRPVVYICAFLSSLIYDIGYSQYMGTVVFSVILAMLSCLIIRYIFNIENWLSVFVTAIAGTLIYNFVFWMINHIAGNTGKFLYMLQYIPFCFLSQLVLLAVLYLLLKRYVVKHKGDNKFR